jgi:hypothetical protein
VRGGERQVCGQQHEEGGHEVGASRDVGDRGPLQRVRDEQEGAEERSQRPDAEAQEQREQEHAVEGVRRYVEGVQPRRVGAAR